MLVSRRLRPFTFVVALVASILIPANVGAAAVDTEGPVLSNFDFTPKTVNAFTGTEDVTVSTHITDATGTETPIVIIRSDATDQAIGYVPMNLTSGTLQSGDWSRRFGIPTTMATGTWTVTILHLADIIGNTDFGGDYDNGAKLTVTNTQVFVPDAPTAVTATAGNGQATVTWTPPANNGGAAISGYTVTSSPGGFTRIVGPGAVATSVTGLTNGTSYTFTVKAKNPVGASVASTPSNPVTPAAPVSVPGAPTGVAATGGNGEATVSWIPPASTGGSAITGYTVTSTPGGVSKTVAGGVTSTAVPGLTNGTSYTFSVKATNVKGDSTASGPSNAVTPTATPTPPLVTGPGGPSNPAVVPATVPGALATPHVTVKGSKVTVTWAPPSSGGSAITSYVVTGSHGIKKTVAAGKAKLVLKHLAPGSYKISVAATNAVGVGPKATVKVRVTA